MALAICRHPLSFVRMLIYLIPIPVDNVIVYILHARGFRHRLVK